MSVRVGVEVGVGVGRGNYVHRKGIARPPEFRAESYVLTPMQLDVLTLLALPLPRADIARYLAISESTVTTHTSAVYEKLGAFNRTHAVVLGIKRGLIGLWEVTDWPEGAEYLRWAQNLRHSTKASHL